MIYACVCSFVQVFRSNFFGLFYDNNENEIANSLPNDTFDQCLAQKMKWTLYNNRHISFSSAFLIHCCNVPSDEFPCWLMDNEEKLLCNKYRDIFFEKKKHNSILTFIVKELICNLLSIYFIKKRGLPVLTINHCELCKQKKPL